MSNPFDDSEGRFVVLVNADGQHSLWPSSIEQPAGWEIAHPEADRQTCLDFVDATWTDMRPRNSL